MAEDKTVLEENWNSKVVWMLQVVVMRELPPLPLVVSAMLVCNVGRSRRRTHSSVTAFPGSINYLYMTKFKLNHLK